MLRALLPFVAGIVAAEYYLLPSAFVWVGFAVSGAIAIAGRSSLCAAAALCCFGWGAAQWNAPAEDDVPRGVRTVFALAAEGAGEGRITAWRDDDGQWREADVRVVLRGDSTLAPQPGERYVVRTRLYGLHAGSSYGRLMRSRGFGGRVYLSERQVLWRRTPQPAGLHAAAAERMRRLGLTGRTHALCAAMAAGDRSGLTAPMRGLFARSGASHLLAVSGLHAGIVFMLANLLLRWLVLLRRGHLLRNGLVVALVWFYAAVTGFSPSVVRAALMCSALQFALASGSLYAGGNALAAAAFAMLACRPAALYDIGFQLSFLSVAAILACGVPLCRRLRTGRRAIDVPVAAAVVSAVATVATAPLAAHTFGTVSFAAVAVNAVAVPLATVVVGTGVLWRAVPLPWAAYVLRPAAEAAASALLWIVERTAALPWAAARWCPDTGTVAAIYLGFLIATLLAGCRERKKTVSLRP